MVTKKVKHKSATQGIKIPKGHPSYNLPDPQGGAFEGSQLFSPGAPTNIMPQGAPMGEM